MVPKRLALGLWLALVIVSVVIIARTSFRTDMAAFLPRSAGQAQQVLTAQATGGAASHLVLLAITGAPPPVLTALSARLAQRMRQQSAFIDVLNGDPASTAGVQDYVWRHRYVLSADVTPDRFTAAGLHAALEDDLGLLGSDMAPLVAQSLPSDPTGEMLTLLPQLDDTAGPRVLDGVWVSEDASRAVLLVHTAAPGFDLDAQASALARINTDFAQAQAALPGAAAARLGVTGPGVFGIHIRDTTKQDVTRLSILATAGALGLLVFAYRSPRVLLLGSLPVATGALAAVAAVSLVFGFVHGVTLGFGVTLIGESLDYAIYLFTQTGRGEAAADTLARIWPTLRLGVVTSVVGFAAMLVSSFTGFAQLGLFSIVGLIVAAGVTRFVLPHLVPHGFFAAGAAAISRPLRAAMAGRRVLRWVLGAAVLAGGAGLAAHRGGLWNDNLADLSPIPPADQALNDRLRHDLGVPDSRFFVVVQAADEEHALQDSEALAARLTPLVAQGELAGFDVPSTILPSQAAQQARKAALPAPAALLANFSRADAGLPFRTMDFIPFFKDVAAAKAAPPLNPASLPPALALRLGTMLSQNGPFWVVMAPLLDVTNPSAVAAAVAGLPGASFVDLNHESDALLHRFQHEAVALAVTGSIAILAILLIGLRAPARVLTVAAPLAAAVVLTAALLTWGSGKLSIFMVVGFLLIIAVGSNYCLFFERPSEDAASWERAIASVALANLCTVAAYGLMAFSRIPVLHDIGLTVALGTFLSLLGAAVLSR